MVCVRGVVCGVCVCVRVLCVCVRVCGVYLCACCVCAVCVRVCVCVLCVCVCVCVCCVSVCVVCVCGVCVCVCVHACVCVLLACPSVILVAKTNCSFLQIPEEILTRRMRWPTEIVSCINRIQATGAPCSHMRLCLTVTCMYIYVLAFAPLHVHDIIEAHCYVYAH